MDDLSEMRNDDGASDADLAGQERRRVALRADLAALLPDVRGYARFLVRERAAADDLVQEALVRALAGLDQFTEGTNLKAWLFTIVRNAFYESIRRRKRESAHLADGDVEMVAIRPHAEIRAQVRDLQTMLWTLPPLLREALILVGAQEMSYEQAAAICAVPVGTIKARVSRARTALAAEVQRAEEGDGGQHGTGDT